jgi:hypothetical protein
VAHSCNPSYSGGRDQEDHSSKPAQANSLRDLIFKNPSQKRAGGVAQGVDPEFEPQYHKKKKEKPHKNKRNKCKIPLTVCITPPMTQIPEAP